MSLSDALTEATFSRAHQRVARSDCPGVDGVRPRALPGRDGRGLVRLREAVRSGSYRPGRLLRFPVRKSSGGERILAVPTAADRVVQTAVLLASEQRLDRVLSPHVHGSRPGRSVHTALADLIRQTRHRPWLELVGADLRSMFDELPHPLVRERSRRAWSDPLWHCLVDRWLDAWADTWQPRRGVPQGAPLSPLLANLALGGLDAALDGIPEVAAWVRYVDDLVLVGERRGSSQQLLRRLDSAVRQQGLRLAGHKTRVALPVSAPRLPALGEELHISEHRRGWRLERASTSQRALGRQVPTPWWLAT